MAFSYNVYERTPNGSVFKDYVEENDYNMAFYKLQRLLSSLYRHVGETPKYPDQTPRFYAEPVNG